MVKFRILLAAMILAILSACAESTLTPNLSTPTSPTPFPTPQSEQTAASSPTPTPAPTTTSIPVATPTPSPTKWIIPTPTLSCYPTNQTPGRIEFDRSDLDIAPAVGSALIPGQLKLIGRVLDNSPLVVEIFQSTTSPTKRHSGYEIQRLFVTENAVADLAALELHDLIEATLVEVWGPGSGDPWWTLGVDRVRRITDLAEITDPTIREFLSRGPVLLFYLSSERAIRSEQLVIYSQGSIYYEDKSRNVISRESLSRTELEELLSVINDSGFDALENETGQGEWWSGPSVALVCSRTQSVSVSNNEEDLRPITRELDKIVADLNQQFDIFVVYGKKRKIEIKPWPYPEIPIADLKTLHDEALAEYRRTGESADDHIVYTELQQEIYDQLASTSRGIPDDWTAFSLFQEGGKVYSVTKGTCIPNPGFCKEGTLYVVSASEVVEPAEREVSFGNRFRLWPTYLGSDLAKASEDGALVDIDEYEGNRKFFDMFFGNMIFVQGTYVFEDLLLEKRER